MCHRLFYLPAVLAGLPPLRDPSFEKGCGWAGVSLCRSGFLANRPHHAARLTSLVVAHPLGVMASESTSLHPERKVTEMLDIQLSGFRRGDILSPYLTTRIFGPFFKYRLKILRKIFLLSFGWPEYAVLLKKGKCRVPLRSGLAGFLLSVPHHIFPSARVSEIRKIHPQLPLL